MKRRGHAEPYIPQELKAAMDKEAKRRGYNLLDLATSPSISQCVTAQGGTDTVDGRGSKGEKTK